MCGKYRETAHYCSQKDKHNLSRKEELFFKLAGAKFIILFNLKYEYVQHPVDNETSIIIINSIHKRCTIC